MSPSTTVRWHTAHQALVAPSTAWFPEPEPARVLDIDKTHARAVRWPRKRPGGGNPARG